MYYPCSENKDADQLRPCKLLVFSRTGSIYFGTTFDLNYLLKENIYILQVVI